MDTTLGIISLLNTSKVFGGISMILINLGSKYVVGDLGIVHEKILTHDYVKKIIILAMFFIATRDIIVSFCLTVIYIIVVDGFLHEKRKYSLVPEKYKNTTIPSQSEYSRACEIVKEYEKSNFIIKNTKLEKYHDYLTNISALN